MNKDDLGLSLKIWEDLSEYEHNVMNLLWLYIKFQKISKTLGGQTIDVR